MENTHEPEVTQEGTTMSPEVEAQDLNQDQPTQPEPSVLEKLTEARTGLFEVPITIEDVKWLKNQCNSKFTFKGPNDAFMLMSVYLGLDGCINHYAKQKDVTSVKLTAGTIEGLAIFINKYEGVGSLAAQRIFNVAVNLQQAIGQMRELDRMIEALEKESQEKEAPATEAPEVADVQP